MSIKNDLSLINKGNLLKENDTYLLVLLAYIIKKYDIKIEQKFENSISFISYIKENVEKLSFSKIEVNLFNEVLSNLSQKILKDDSIYKTIQKIINNYDRESFIEYANEIGNTNNKQYISSSESIIDLSLNILKCKKSGKLLDINSGSGDFLVRAINKYNDIYISGYETNINNSLDLRIRMFILNSNFEFKYGSFLNEEDDNYYDGIFAMLSSEEKINNIITKNIEYKGNNSIWLYIDRIISRIGTKGRAIVIAPPSSLFKKSDASIREYLIKNKLLEAIIKLPDSIGISFTMLVISRNNHYTRLIDSSNMLDISKIIELYTNDYENSKIITDVEFKEKDYSFIPSVYLKNITNKMNHPVILKDYANVIRGYRGITTNNKDNKCKYIILKSITNGLLDKNSLEIVDYEEKMSKYILQDKDVIVTARGSRFESTVIRVEDNEKLVCGENFYILRINNKELNPYYLSAFLNSEIGKESLFSNTVKTKMLSISSEDLLNLIIDLIEIEEQKQLEKLLIEKEKIYFDYNNKMKKICDKVNNSIRRNMFLR